LINKLRKEREMTSLETPPTQELPVEVAPAAPSGTQRRYRALVAAVRSHELVSSHPAVPKRPADHALYEALSDVQSVPAIHGDRSR
jgi:hypothetical protein